MVYFLRQDTDKIHVVNGTNFLMLDFKSNNIYFKVKQFSQYYLIPFLYRTWKDDPLKNFGETRGKCPPSPPLASCLIETVIFLTLQSGIEGVIISGGGLKKSESKYKREGCNKRGGGGESSEVNFYGMGCYRRRRREGQHMHWIKTLAF